MKALARSYIWWSGIDTDVEELAHECETCQLHQNSPSKAPLHPWEWTTAPWQRIHIDFAEYAGKPYLIVIDSHSKWLEAIPTTGTKSSHTIDALRRMFATHGLPDICVSDNATAFLAEEFALFMSKHGVQHITTAPYHPSSNGMAERAVATFKRYEQNAG